MNAPWHLRDPDAPSELTLDAFVAGEATPDEAARVEAWAAADPAHQAALDARRAGFAALPSARPQAMQARIAQALDARPVAATPHAGVEHLDRDAAVEVRIVGDVDRPHPALAEQPVDLVAPDLLARLEALRRVDFGDIVVHVQHSEERSFYDLERLWKDCPRIEVPDA